MANYDSGQDSDMSQLYDGSMGSDNEADTAKDTSGDDETVDEQDQQDMANSSVVPMSMLKNKDGKPPKRGDKIEIVVMSVYGGKDAQICRADQWSGKDMEEGEGTKEEEMSPDEEIDSLSTRM